MSLCSFFILLFALYISIFAFSLSFYLAYFRIFSPLSFHSPFDLLLFPFWVSISNFCSVPVSSPLPLPAIPLPRCSVAIIAGRSNSAAHKLWILSKKDHSVHVSVSIGIIGLHLSMRRNGLWLSCYAYIIVLNPIISPILLFVIISSLLPCFLCLCFVCPVKHANTCTNIRSNCHSCIDSDLDS